MALMVEKTGKTVEDAINEALEELGITSDEAIIEVLDEGGAGGVLGIGRRLAKVRVSLDEENIHPNLTSDEAPVYYGDDEFTEEPESAEEAETTAYVAAIMSGIGIHGKISSYREDETLHIEISGQDVGAAIGHHGETLDAIQYLATLVANRNTESRLRVSVDIGGYRRRRESTLISMAERSAEKVARSGRAFKMEPMNPAERRIVHSALQNFPGVSTHSEGEEPERCVVITPAEA
ncbi:MAG: protein jag [Eubacteriales bacterium]|nr:protein jag [Eubacteriales bacterium]